MKCALIHYQLHRPPQLLQVRAHIFSYIICINSCCLNECFVLPLGDFTSVGKWMLSVCLTMNGMGPYLRLVVILDFTK